MSGIDIVDLSVLTEKDMQIALDQTESMARSNPVRNIDEIVLSLTAEIRRLRAQNKELRDSYERVEKHAAELSRQREKQADMIRTIDPLYR